uniref:Uncharacterized protein n=1 Tax=Burkholderia sp. M701 TaxID=326454 RepID=V5YPF2_9BURK|nr:hypothetical protein [Burkholderia sp. M701]
MFAIVCFPPIGQSIHRGRMPVVTLLCWSCIQSGVAVIDVPDRIRLPSTHALPLHPPLRRHHHDDYLHRRVVWRLRTLDAGQQRNQWQIPRAPPETDGALGVSGPSVCGIHRGIRTNGA